MTKHDDRSPLMIRTPADLVSAVPYLLGFHPENSLVVIGSGGPHGTCAMRIDLPPADVTAGGAAADIADRFARMLGRNGFPAALLVGYGPAERVTPLIDAAGPALAEHEVELHDALRVTGDRFWSYFCTGTGCCPAEGTPFDVATSVVAAQATFAGQVALPGRAELARTVAPLGGVARASMREATDRAEHRLFELLRTGSDAEPDAAVTRIRMAEAGLPILRALLSRAGLGARRPDDDEIAWLGVLLTCTRVRDEAWVRVDLGAPQPHIAFWQDVLCRVEEPYAPAPACLLAYAAFAAGNGGLANVALERALDTDPDYSMAHLLHGLLSTGAPPSSVRQPMTPADLAAAYGEHDTPETGPDDDRRAG